VVLDKGQRHFVSGRTIRGRLPQRIAEINPPPSRSDDKWENLMLERGARSDSNSGRMVMLFSMKDGDNEIPCAIATTHGQMERVPWTKDEAPRRAKNNFLRLRGPPPSPEQCAVAAKKISPRKKKKPVSGHSRASRPASITALATRFSADADRTGDPRDRSTAHLRQAAQRSDPGRPRVT
jgi:hypothetical protein